jgi:FAD/FMN-containing dehydrogenase
MRAPTARVRAGARWADVTGPASFLGLAPAAGFASGASVVGTVLGDGMGWLARRHGLAAAGVRTVEFVTGDGELERCDELPRDGVITALETSWTEGPRARRRGDIAGGEMRSGAPPSSLAAARLSAFPRPSHRRAVGIGGSITRHAV